MISTADGNRNRQPLPYLSHWCGDHSVLLLKWRCLEALAVDKAEVAGAQSNDTLVFNKGLLHDLLSIQDDRHCGDQAAHVYLNTDIRVLTPIFAKCDFMTTTVYLPTTYTAKDVPSQHCLLSV